LLSQELIFEKFFLEQKGLGFMINTPISLQYKLTSTSQRHASQIKASPQFGKKQPEESTLKEASKKEASINPATKSTGYRTLLAVSAFSGVSGFLGGLCGGFYNTPTPKQPVQVVQIITQQNKELPQAGLNATTMLTSEAPPGHYYRVQDPPLPHNFGLPRNRCGDDGYPPETPQNPEQNGTQPDESMPKAPPILGADEAKKQQEEARKKELQEFEKAQKEHMQKEYVEALKQKLLFNTNLDPKALSADVLKHRQEIQGKLQSNALEKSTRRDDLYESLAAYVQPATVQLIAEFHVSSYRIFQPHPFMPPEMNEGLPFPQSGTGFFINNTGMLLTNNHVVELSYRDKSMNQQTRLTDKLHVKLADGKVSTAKLVAADKKLDLALYQLEGEHKDLPYLELATTAKSGTEVMAMGHPIGNQWSASFGKISNPHRTILGGQFIETDTKINPGNSGGPLVNNQGQVVGVNVMINTTEPGQPGSPIGQAIPYNTVKTFIEANLKK
jgi:S1-C subfamily serine protease